MLEASQSCAPNFVVHWRYSRRAGRNRSPKQVPGSQGSQADEPLGWRRLPWSNSNQHFIFHVALHAMFCYTTSRCHANYNSCMNRTTQRAIQHRESQNSQQPVPSQRRSITWNPPRDRRSRCPTRGFGIRRGKVERRRWKMQSRGLY